jgi:hypothetical protein
MNSNPFQLIIPLRQHTPIIHFQHEQAGATLRATELKPKIDRFIIHNYEQISDLAPYQDLIVKYWISPNRQENNKPFNSPYKLRVVGEVNSNERYLAAARLDFHQQKVLRDNKIIPLSGAPYFAQEKEINQLFEKGLVWDNRKNKEITAAVALKKDKLNGISKWGIMAMKNEKSTPPAFFIQADSLNTEIIKVLAIVIPHVLVCENFGTRQSKGFGCFSPMEMNEDEFEGILKKCFKFTYKSNSTKNDLQAVFQTINNEYQVLKAGRIHGKYAKSKLFLHGVGSLDIRWEKRKIKQEIQANLYPGTTLKQEHFPPVFDEIGNTSWTDPEPFDYRYIRALLGLAEQFEFLTTDNKYKYIVQVKSQNGIERHKTPLLYKVFNNRIYLVGSEVENAMLGKWFDFQLKYKNVGSGNFVPDPEDTRKDFERPLQSLQTPESFSLENFIDFALSNSNDEKIGSYQKL